MNKDVRQLIERVTSFPGVTVDRSATHPRVYKDGVFVTALPSTPSNNRWYQNAVSALKRGGIDIYDMTVKRKEKPMAVAVTKDSTAGNAGTVSPTMQLEGQTLHRIPTSQFALAKEPATER